MNINMASNLIFRLSAIPAKSTLFAVRGASIGRHLQRVPKSCLLPPGPSIAQRIARKYSSPSITGALAKSAQPFNGPSPNTSNVITKSHGCRSLHTSSSHGQELFVLPKDANSGSKHWFTERLVAIGLLGLVPVGIMYPVQLVDYSLAVLLPLHSYWGINAILGDYFWRPGLPVAKATWLLVSLLSTAGLLYINVHDVGICKLIAMFLNI